MKKSKGNKRRRVNPHNPVMTPEEHQERLKRIEELNTDNRKYYEMAPYPTQTKANETSRAQIEETPIERGDQIKTLIDNVNGHIKALNDLQQQLRIQRHELQVHTQFSHHEEDQSFVYATVQLMLVGQ